jgi:alkylation response protein AidB-like acyl-CoA dehydrogenase
LWRKIAGLGWLGLVFPPEFGGSAMDSVDLAVLCEELGRATFPGPYLQAVVFGGMNVLEAGSQEQKAAILPRLIEGSEIIVPVIDESAPKGGQPSGTAESITVRGMPEGRTYVLSGRALFVNNAGSATTLLVPAVTGARGDSEKGVTLFLVSSSAIGIGINPLASLAGENPCEVVFGDVRIPAESVLGRVDEGWGQLQRAIRIGAVMSSAQMLGAGERLLQIAKDDYETRTSADASARDPHTVEYLARLRHDLDCCSAAVYQAARKLAADEQGGFDTVLAAWEASAEDGV